MFFAVEAFLEVSDLFFKTDGDFVLFHFEVGVDLLQEEHFGSQLLVLLVLDLQSLLDVVIFVRQLPEYHLKILLQDALPTIRTFLSLSFNRCVQDSILVLL